MSGWGYELKWLKLSPTERNKNMDTSFSRDELQDLRQRALGLAGTTALNKGWERAYLTLADAADCLDAMLARTIVHESRNVISVGEGESNG